MDYSICLSHGLQREISILVSIFISVVDLIDQIGGEILVGIQSRNGGVGRMQFGQGASGIAQIREHFSAVCDDDFILDTRDAHDLIFEFHIFISFDFFRVFYFCLRAISIASV